MLAQTPLTCNDDVDFFNQRRMRGNLALIQPRVTWVRVQYLQSPIAGISVGSDKKEQNSRK